MNSCDNHQQRSYARSADVYSQTLAGEAVLLDLRTGRYWGLDEVGTRIWELLEEGRSVAAIVEALSDEYDVDTAALERDTGAFVQTLAAGGLIEAIG